MCRNVILSLWNDDKAYLAGQMTLKHFLRSRPSLESDSEIYPNIHAKNNFSANKL